MKKLTLTAMLLLITGVIAFSQSAIIRGTILDESIGEPLMFCSVVIKDSNPINGTQTDLDGRFELKVEPGTYTLEATYIGYDTKIIEGVLATNGKVTILDFFMNEQSLELEQVVVEAKRIDRTENALLALQRKAIGIQDGISSQEISRFGASNAAESMKRVTGASVVDGKYIFVRGLGDRYSNAQLNGQQLPSTNPYRNSSQLDLIPANLIDNVIAAKTFTPDLPGNFTGGNVDIKTRSFPERFTMSIGLSASYNTIANRNDEFLQDGISGNTDWLGYDDGSRALPEILKDPAVNEKLITSAYITARRDDELAGIVDEATRSLQSPMAPVTGRSGLNHGISFALGNQFKLGENPLGLIFGLNYTRSYGGFNNARIEDWQLTDRNSDFLNENFRFNSSMGSDNPQLGGMLGLSYKFGTSNKISFTALYNHDAEMRATFQEGPAPNILGGAGFILETRGIQFTEREIQNYSLNGEHVFAGLKNTKLEWGGSYITSFQKEPNMRLFANSKFTNPNTEESSYNISPSEFDLPFHFFRDLQDEQYNGKLDITIPFSKDAFIKFGGLYSNKTRNFEELRYQYQNKSPYAENYDGDPDFFFGPDNVGQIGYNEQRDWNLIGLYLTNETKLDNIYNGEEEVIAGYAMASFNIGNLKVIGGARLETTNISVVSANPNNPEGKVDQTDILPSLSLIYKLTEKTNLRGSVSQTLARPNMRELAPFSAFDFIGGFIYTGNPTIDRTLVQNYDLRWEFYPNSGEIFAISTYFKNFQNPIIQAFIQESQNPEIKFQNVDQAIVYGVELEFRKKLSFIHPSMKNWKFSTNFSYIFSEVDLTKEEEAVINELNPEFGGSRPFQGQSPFLLNAALNYNNIETGWDAILSFNIFGERLAEINRFGTPDVYQQPIPQLDFSIKKSFMDNRYTIKLSIANILDAKFRKTMTFKGTEYTFIEQPRGRTIGMSINYTIR